jgi:hypothetical protein
MTAAPIFSIPPPVYFAVVVVRMKIPLHCFEALEDAPPTVLLISGIKNKDPAARTREARLQDRLPS